MSYSGQVDSSIYSNLKQPDVIGALSGVTQIQRGRIENAAMGQQLEANAAMGPILQSSIDPQTGQVDYAKAAIKMAQDPRTAFRAPDFMAQAVQRQGNQLDNQLKQFDVVKQQQGMFGRAAASLASLGDNVTRSDVAKRISELHTEMTVAGITDPKMNDGLIQFMASLPEGGHDLAQTLQQVSMNSETAADSMNRVQGAFTTVDAGGQTHLMFTHPATGQASYVGTVTKTPSTGEMNAPTPVVNPQTGQQTTVPRVQAMPMFSGSGQQINPAPGVSLGGEAPAGVNLSGGPVAPAPAAGSPPAPPGTQSSVAGAPFGGGAATGAVTALAPAQEAWLKAQGSNAGKYASDLQSELEHSTNLMQTIEHLQTDTKHIKLGAMLGARTEMAAALQGLGFPRGAYDPLAGGSLAEAQDFKKNSTLLSMNNLREAMGGQGRITNMEFNAFQRANPTLDTDPRAAVKILDFMHRLVQLKVQEKLGFDKWVKSGRDPSEYQGAFVNQLLSRGIIHQNDIDIPQ